MSVTDIARASGRDIEAITKDILENKRSGGKAVLAIGWGLVEAKEQLSHGEWLPWLAEQIGFSERQAQRFMRLAREYSNPTLVSDLGARKALALLALPEPEREEFVELRHVVDGAERSVADMSAAQLEQLIRERDEARQAQYQAEAERSLAETERDELSDQIKILTAANEQGQQAVMNALAQADQMERKIAELKARPVEVAVQVDQAAVDKVADTFKMVYTPSRPRAGRTPSPHWGKPRPGWPWPRRSRRHPPSPPTRSWLSSRCCSSRLRALSISCVG